MNLKELRTKHNLTQAVLAKELGVTSNAISAIEGGRLKLSDKLSAKIKEVYGGAEAAAIAEAEKAFEAEAKAAQMRAEAEAAGKALCEQTEKEVRAEIAETMEQVRATVDEMTAQMLEEAKAEAEAVAEAARFHRKGAEKLVIRGLDAKCR